MRASGPVLILVACLVMLSKLKLKLPAIMKSGISSGVAINISTVLLQSWFRSLTWVGIDVQDVIRWRNWVVDDEKLRKYHSPIPGYFNFFQMRFRALLKLMMPPCCVHIAWWYWNLIFVSSATASTELVDVFDSWHKSIFCFLLFINKATKLSVVCWLEFKYRFLNWESPFWC